MPGIGRFISQDAIGWASGQTNDYAYAGDDPINFADPSGFDSTVAGVGGGRGGGGGGGGPGGDDWDYGDGNEGLDALDRETARNEAWRGGAPGDLV